MSTIPTQRSSQFRTVRRAVALGGLGAFLAIVGGPSCAEIQTSSPSAAGNAPKHPTNVSSPDLASDTYFDQILAVDSNATAAGDSATTSQLQLVATTSVVSSSSSGSNPAVSQSWAELLESAAGTPSIQGVTTFANPQPTAPAVVVSVKPTLNKSTAATPVNTASSQSSTPVASSKPVNPVQPKPTTMPEEQSAAPIAAATTPDMAPAASDPVESATKPVGIAPAPIAATTPDAPKSSDPTPGEQPQAVAATAATGAGIAPGGCVVTTPVAEPAPAPAVAGRVDLPSNFGFFTLTMRIAALAALLATITLAFFSSKSTDRAGVTARSLNLRTRFILAFGGLATVSVVACAFASEYVLTLAGVTTITACAIGSVAAAAVVCLWLERSTSQPLDRINKTVRALATGDLLQKPINSSVRDEFGDLARGVDRLTANMRDALTEIAISSSEITGAATQIATGVKDMTSSATEVAKQCAEASRAAAEVSRDATDGHGAIQQTAEGLSAFGQLASSHAAGIKSIQSRSQQVADLIKLIDDLAERTNVVALNASVEASRSGTNSRTFAMLADEARRLSEQAQTAAAEAAQTVQSLDAETRTVSEKVAGSESQLRQGAAVASKARADYETISSRTFTVAGAVQKAGLVAESFGNTAAMSEAAATQLASRSSHMASVMKRFKLDTSKLVPVNNRSSGQVVEQVPTAV